MGNGTCWQCHFEKLICEFNCGLQIERNYINVMVQDDTLRSLKKSLMMLSVVLVTLKG